ncbi:MAG: NB-ARC domain-containing protein, partial [Pseudomonadota bacterium]|nr:NB-ARC domain-containing protein [Pseudomonadota bacterium]
MADKAAAKARFERDVLCAMDEYAVVEREAVHRLCQKGMATLLEKERGGQPVEPFVEKRLSRCISRETYYKWVKQETNCLHDLQRFYAVLDRLFEEGGSSEGGRLSRLVALTQPEPLFNMAAERLPVGAVPREGKINEVANRLRVLRRQPQPAKARIEGRTVVLSGRRGFGKTTLAAACGRDPRIRSYFPGGIGWLALGEPQTLKHQVEGLIQRMAQACPAPVKGFQDLLPQKTAARAATFDDVLAQLAITLGERHVLLVMDDVGERKTLDVLYRALVNCSNCYVLLTTRYDAVLDRDVQPVRVEGMREDEAVALLQQGLPELGDTGHTDAWKAWAVGAVRFHPLRITRIHDAIAEGLVSHRPLKQVLEQIRARLQHAGPRAFDGPRLEHAFHLLLPAESVLKIGESDSLPAKMFRKTGPIAVDFDAGMVHRREQVSEVQAMLKQDAAAVLVQGVAASGKSVVARQVAYELVQDDWTVYMHMLNRSERLQQRVKLQEEIAALASEQSLVVIEDVHLASPVEINQMLLVLGQQRWPKLLLTSRKIEVEAGESDNVPNRLQELSRIKLQPFDAAKSIIELFFQKEKIPAQGAWIDEVKKASRTSLWLLAIALESLDAEAARKGHWKG